MDVKSFKKQLIEVFNEMLGRHGFKGKRLGKGYTWEKIIDDGDYKIGLGFWVDARDKNRPQFRVEQLLDTSDITDIRAYHHSGMPPKEIIKDLAITVPLTDKIFGARYDRWFNIPERLVTAEALTAYAAWLIEDLERHTEIGKRIVTKTHRWEL